MASLVRNSAFVRRYSRETAVVVGRLRQGWSCRKIADTYGYNYRSVCTVKGNLTRGAYASFLTR